MKTLFILLFAVSFPAMANDLSAVKVGVTGGGAFGNLFVGPTVAVELPIARHFELDGRDIFSPLESHIGLGRGYDNGATAEPIFWLKHNVGLDSRVDWTQYHVTKVSKHGTFVYGGIALKGTSYYTPIRVMLDYFREVNNGVYGHGIETSHLQGGSVYVQAEVGCSKRLCFYTTLESAVGRLLEQGNPSCDGSFGPNACPRQRNVSGSGIMGFLISTRK